MNFGSKSPKIARHTFDEQEDRLSSFPEHLLCHILSFLPTKYAAMTSLLSKKWMDLFLGVPNVDLNESLILLPGNKQPQEENRIKNHDFINFVNRRLMLCKTSIKEFRLKCELPEAPCFNLWINSLLFHNVEVLEIEVYEQDKSPVGIPRRIFSSETLVVLKLHGSNIVLKVCEFVSMPNLKVLHIKDLQMQFESSNGGLGEGYPLLEDVRMDKIGLPKSRAILKISLPSLKKFALVDKGRERCRIDIDVSLLQYFEYSAGYGQPSMEISACKFESLVAANLSTFRVWYVLAIVGEWFFVDIIRMVQKVKSLHLSGKFVLGLSKFAGSLPRFPNLTCLELTIRFGDGLKTMWSLLQCAPNLETLFVEMEGCGYRRQCYGTPENEPLCLAENVREIRIINYGGYEADFEVVKYLLQHGAVVERMTIVPESSATNEWPSSMWRPLMKLRWCSPKCEIELENFSKEKQQFRVR